MHFVDFICHFNGYLYMFDTSIKAYHSFKIISKVTKTSSALSASGLYRFVTQQLF
jgi:hypothetical protein